MPTYGPWTQDPDYQTVGSANATTNYNEVVALDAPARYHFEIYDTASGWYSPVPPGTVRTLAQTLLQESGHEGWNVAGPMDSPDGIGGASVAWELYNTNGTRDTPRTDAVVKAVAEVWALRPPAFSRYFPTNSGGEYDEASIGVQWQDTGDVVLWDDYDSSKMPRPAWLTAALDPSTTLDLLSRDDQGVNGGSGALRGPWHVQILAGTWGIDTETVFSALMSATQNGETSLAAFAAGPVDITAQLTAALASRGFLGLHVYSPSVVRAAVEDAPRTQWQYDARFRLLQIAWTLRPPVYRWIYPDGQRYRRIFPRDDSLPGGAGRNFPRPKSLQSSNRTSGSYL